MVTGRRSPHGLAVGSLAGLVIRAIAASAIISRIARPALLDRLGDLIGRDLCAGHDPGDDAEDGL